MPIPETTRTPSIISNTSAPVELPSPPPEPSRKPLMSDGRERNDFQDFILQSVGRDLPLYGSELFKGGGGSFATQDFGLVPGDYVVGPGDELHIRGWGQINVDVRTRVERDGTISIPNVGTVSVVGARYQDLGAIMRAAFSRVFRNFELSVSLGRVRSIQILVVGQARRPGTHSVSALSTLLNALFATGGPSAKGSLRKIQLKRGSKTVVEFDLYDLLISGDKSNDVVLQNGDVIFIPPIGSLVALSGNVNHPAIYELKDASTVSDLIRWAGGLSTTALGERVTIERIENRTSRKVEEVRLVNGSSSAPLRDGDLVTAYAVPPRFENAVTVRGNVIQPSRVPWKAGMRVRDLIPDPQSLVTREYWSKWNQTVGLSPDVSRILAQQTGAGTSLEVTDLQRRLQNEPDVTVAEDIRRRQVEFEANRLVEATTVGAPVPAQARPAGQPMVGNQQGMPVNQQGFASQPMQPGLNTSATQARGVANAPRPDVVSDPSRALNQIRPNGKEVNWDYAVIERLDRRLMSTSIVPFSLAKAVLDGDPQHNILIEPGDVLTIFSKEDIRAPIGRQTKFVRLEGEFVSAGVYQVLPGETLRQLVVRVGGVTPNAYLFGAEFTRESTRRQQARNLEDAINRLERDIQQYNTIRPGNLTTPEDAAGLRVQMESQATLLSRLRQIRPTGRIVLEVPEDGRISNLPDMALEDGDRLLVPSQPSMINVFGSVFNESSFVYRPEKRMADYLAQAGGPTRTADPASSYVLRADGSVFSRRNNSSVFGDVVNMRLMPGDSIIVPEEYDRTTWTRALRDWAQIFYQFGLGAAAVRVLRN